MGSLYLINITRILVLVTSLLAFTCHLVQTAVLLPIYQQKTGIPNWIPAGHWQYLTWYVSLGLSLIGGIVTCTRLCCCKYSHIVRGDKFLAIFIIVPLFISILTAVLLEGPEPWTNGTVEFQRPAFAGLFSSCSQLDEHLDPSYPLLYNRCMLSDSTLVGAIIACIFWVILTCLACCFRAPSRFSVAPRFSAKEPEWGRYIPDPLISPVQFRHQHYLRTSPDPSIGSMSTFYVNDDHKSRTTVRHTHYSEKFELSDPSYTSHGHSQTPPNNTQTLSEWGDDTEEQLARIAYLGREANSANRPGKHPLSPSTISTTPSMPQYSWPAKPHQKVYTPNHY